MAVNRMQLVPRLRSDKLEVSIELHRNGDPLGHILLDASGVEAAIAELAGTRAQMADEVPRELDPGSTVRSVPDPVWRVQRYQDGTVALLLRHPGAGWLGFVLPDREARHMAAVIEGRAAGNTPAADDAV